ncbi:MAG: TIGR00730 family Rossman fold protein [Gammaproteobacteria bacterium]
MNSVCVFAGSSIGRSEEYAEGARKLARELVTRDYTLVYGGGNVGLMGVLAQSVMEGGGRVIGVIPEALKLREVADYSITELKVVHSMHERKALMSDLSDGVIALPGGLGTLEELFEMLTWAQLGFHARPVALLNAAGYYNTLLEFLDRVVDEGFMRPQHRELLLTGSEPGPLLDAMNTWQSPISKRWLERGET